MRAEIAFLRGDLEAVVMYRVSETVRCTDGQDGAIVLNIRGGQMFNLNRIGARIFELVRQGHGESSIVHEIHQDCAASQGLVAKDVQEFLCCLERFGLIQESQSGKVK